MTDSEAEDVCDSCGKTEIALLDFKSKLRDNVRKQMDEEMYGMQVECSDCGRRLEPREHIKIYSDDGEVVADGTDLTPKFNEHLGEYYGKSVIEDDDELEKTGMAAMIEDDDSEEVNFLDEGTFRHGMD
jgi:hypothetical protein